MTLCGRFCCIVNRNKTFLQTTVSRFLLVMSENLFTPPPGVRGMEVLDRQAFNLTVQVPAIKIPTKAIGGLLKPLRSILLKRPNTKKLVDIPDDQLHKVLLFDPDKVVPEEHLTGEHGKLLQENGVTAVPQLYDLQLGYDSWTAQEVLTAILPEGEVTTAFSRVGHIAHLNLRDHQLPYKTLIGQVIMDKNQGITSVVNKTNIINNTFRFFSMELIAGEDKTTVTVKENHCSFEFDFAQVYWNPRLGTEHERITNKLSARDVVYDVFAGVGPFSIPAARKRCEVLANDLNPESYKWLVHNTKLNKVQDRVRTFNMDGRQFIKEVVKKDMIDRCQGEDADLQDHTSHVIMNLPAMAVEFLDVFRGLLAGEMLPEYQPPMIHCHTFSKADDPAADARRRVEEVLGAALPKDHYIHRVRDVAPNKEMMCVSFQMPLEVLRTHQGETDPSEPDRKKLKTET
ncbi:tRNA (guanine(37)-N1)-methyltransferase-like [Branchiostoma lanceolatum]|uniref:tRNA (guanine(37)-N1)-methyltransferase-like n=1 Tax=Branchiostoma lanceolatum TaxID=7740 RepID=UPI0034571935